MAPAPSRRVTTNLPTRLSGASASSSVLPDGKRDGTALTCGETTLALHAPKTKAAHLSADRFRFLVEPVGIEPLWSAIIEGPNDLDTLSIRAVPPDVQRLGCLEGVCGARSSPFGGRVSPLRRAGRVWSSSARCHARRLDHGVRTSEGVDFPGRRAHLDRAAGGSAQQPQVHGTTLLASEP